MEIVSFVEHTSCDREKMQTRKLCSPVDISTVSRILGKDGIESTNKKKDC